MCLGRKSTTHDFSLSLLQLLFGLLEPLILLPLDVLTLLGLFLLGETLGRTGGSLDSAVWRVESTEHNLQRQPKFCGSA